MILNNNCEIGIFIDILLKKIYKIEIIEIVIILKMVMKFILMYKI